MGQLFENNAGAGKSAVAATRLGDGPGQGRLDGRGGLVDVVAVDLATKQ